MKKDHDVHNMGDFENCKRADCQWSATWSLGHICDHCHLTPCICPCPLTKEWLVEHEWEIAGKRIAELIAHDLGSDFFMLEQEEKNKDNKDSVYYGRSNKYNWERKGKFEALQRLITYVKVNHRHILQDYISPKYFCTKCKFLIPICRCKK